MLDRVVQRGISILQVKSVRVCTNMEKKLNNSLSTTPSSQVQSGEPGLRHFFESTEGWDTPVLDDRDAPRYQHAQTLDGDQAEMFESVLADYSVKIEKA